MFRCLDTIHGTEVVILDHGVDVGALRARGRAGKLACPECRQPVEVKAGEIKAWHFAHEALGECALRHESPAVLKARRVLYEWLRSKFVDRLAELGKMPAKVSIEQRIGAGLPRPIDCLVEMPGGRKHAYWIMERGMRDREGLEAELRALHVRIHWVFLQSMMRPVAGSRDVFDLTPTERDFSRKTRYDKLYAHDGVTLTYLDADQGKVISLRALMLCHAPQRYRSGRVLEHALAEMLTSPHGYFIHPGEHDALLRHDAEQKEKEELRKREEEEARVRREAERAQREAEEKELEAERRRVVREYEEREREKKAQAVRERREAYSASVSNEREPQVGKLPEPDAPAPDDGPLRAIAARMGEALPCTGCGRKTREWAYATLAAGTCLCRECDAKERAAKGGEDGRGGRQR